MPNPVGALAYTPQNRTAKNYNPDTGSMAAVSKPLVPSHLAQAGRFLLVGGIGVIVNLAVFYLFSQVLGFHYALAAPLAFIAAVLNNFLLNSWWTFSHSDVGYQLSKEEGKRFVAVSLAAMLAGLLLIIYMVDVLSFNEMGAQLLAIFLVTPINFFANKHWVFHTRSTV